VLACLGCAATTTRDIRGQYIDDSVITTKVKPSLFGDPSLKSNEISVEAFVRRRSRDSLILTIEGKRPCVVMLAVAQRPALGSAQTAPDMEAILNE
jgi:hypothetical protein